MSFNLRKKIDIHGYIRQVEIQEIHELGSCDPEFKYGM